MSRASTKMESALDRPLEKFSRQVVRFMVAGEVGGEKRLFVNLQVRGFREGVLTSDQGCSPVQAHGWAQLLV